MPTQTKEHLWTEFTMTAVQAIKDGQGGVSFLPVGEPVTTYGCSACNMGISEGIENDCPGFDLFEEAVNG